MAPEYLKGLLFLLGVTVVILAAAAFGEWYVQRKVERWARTRGLQLLEFSGAPFWRGPRAWRRNDDQEDYRVVVEDAAGRRRSGWLLYTSRWRGLGPQEVLNSQTKCNTFCIRCCDGTELWTTFFGTTLHHCPASPSRENNPPNRGSYGSRAIDHSPRA